MTTESAPSVFLNVYKTKFNDNNCVIKILIPKIQKKIQKSLDNIQTIKTLSKYVSSNIFQSFNSFNFNEYSNFFLNQTNLLQETNHLKKFKKIFKNTQRIIIPEIYLFDSSKIIMSEEKGFSLQEINVKYPSLYEEALLLLVSFIYKSISNNILHGDLHLGNFKFKINKNFDPNLKTGIPSISLIVYDFGIIVNLDNDDKKHLLTLFTNAVPFKKKKESMMFLLNKNNIKLKNPDICPLQSFINMKNFHEIFEINSIPVNYINLFFSLSTVQLLVKNKKILSKVPLFMLKNNFTKIKNIKTKIRN